MADQSTDITLITPPACSSALEAALSQNPYLTSLPSPSADILAPPSLTLTTGTAELLRIKEVQAVIKNDFLLLPCDLVCEIPGESLLEAWMISQSGLGGATGGDEDSVAGPRMVLGGEKGGRRGGLGVWYQTKGEQSIKGEETDFIATTSIKNTTGVRPPEGSLRNHISNLVYSIPTDSLNDVLEEKGSLPIRHSLIRKHGRVKMLTTHRDAHIYFLPYWVKEYALKNEKFESASEDLVGWWAKAGWQDGLGDKLGMREIFEGSPEKEDGSGSNDSTSIEEEIDLSTMSTTSAPPLPIKETKQQFASRVRSSPSPSVPKPHLETPPMHAYVHPSNIANAPLLHRVDTPQLLLHYSLALAKLPAQDETGTPHPLSHSSKIAKPSTISEKTNISKSDSLISTNVSVADRCVIKESVLGANVSIGANSRLTRCLVMDGAVIGEKCTLTGTIVGRRAKVGDGCKMNDCQVQDGFGVESETSGKSESFMRFEGLEEDDAVDEDDFGDGGVDDIGFGGQ